MDIQRLICYQIACKQVVLTLYHSTVGFTVFPERWKGVNVFLYRLGHSWSRSLSENIYINNYYSSRTWCLFQCLVSVLVSAHVTSVNLDVIYEKASSWAFAAGTVLRASGSEVRWLKRLLGSSAVTYCNAQTKPITQMHRKKWLFVTI